MTLNSDEGSVTADVAAHQRLSRIGVSTAAPLLYPFLSSDSTTSIVFWLIS
jgi:hypothetical protein